MSRSHVQGASSYFRFRKFGVADNGRPYSTRISSAIAQSITMLSATPSDLLLSLNRLCPIGLKSWRVPREWQSPGLKVSWRVANFRLQQSVLLAVMVEKISQISRSLSWNPFLDSLSRVCLEKVNAPQLAKKFPHILWNQIFYYRVGNSSSHVPVLSQINPFHAPSHALFLKSISTLQDTFKDSNKSSLVSTSWFVVCFKAEGWENIITIHSYLTYTIPGM